MKGPLFQFALAVNASVRSLSMITTTPSFQYDHQVTCIVAWRFDVSIYWDDVAYTHSSFNLALLFIGRSTYFQELSSFVGSFLYIFFEHLQLPK